MFSKLGCLVALALIALALFAASEAMSVFAFAMKAIEPILGL
jgi:hypothetical protein